MLSVRGLARRFGSLQALRDATFHVAPGEVLGLIGPNGAGKSTLFQCLAGLLSSDGGEVWLDDRELSPGERAGAMIFLPDGISPWRDQRAGWVLDFARHAMGASEDWRAELASVLRLPEIAGQRMGELSKGQRKRVLLAIALLAPRRYVLLDEPFDGLDLRHARDVAAHFRARALQAGGRAIFVSMHSMHEAARVCDRLVLLSEGSVSAEGTLDELRARAGLPGADLEEVFLALT